MARLPDLTDPDAPTTRSACIPELPAACGDVESFTGGTWTPGPELIALEDCRSAGGAFEPEEAQTCPTTEFVAGFTRAPAWELSGYLVSPFSGENLAATVALSVGLGLAAIFVILIVVQASARRGGPRA